MVGALMYLTASRPDIVHATCYYACYQAKPTEKHLTAVKQIFWYLKDSINMGLWYPKDTSFELTTFSDSDHAGCLDSRKSTSAGIQFIGGDKSENDAFTFDGAVQIDTFNLKKSMNIVESRKIGVIWSLDFLGVCKRCKIPFICENGLTIVWNFENLTELCSRESDEFTLDHE
ncbi:hypothetical protein Tco_0871758 [Tanacetum coccineum]